MRAAIDSMLRALQKFTIDGIATAIPFHRMLLDHKDFRKGRVHTKSAEEDFVNQRKAMTRGIASKESS